MIEPLQKDDAFLADVRKAKRRREELHLWWLGQSGFLVQYDHGHLLLDPYLSDSLTKKYAGTDKPHVRMTARVVDPRSLDFIDIVTSSHNHTDHFDPETLGAMLQVGTPRVIVPQANLLVAQQRIADRATMPTFTWLAGIDCDGFLEHAGFCITAVPAAHETIERDERGHMKCLGYVIECGPFTIYHAGDTVLYDDQIERLRPFHVDVAILPINGRAPERRVAGNLWGREAAQLAHAIGAQLVVPCHYEMFEFNTAPPDEFIAECERLKQRYHVLRAGERLDVKPLETT